MVLDTDSLGVATQAKSATPACRCSFLFGVMEIDMELTNEPRTQVHANEAGEILRLADELEGEGN